MKFLSILVISLFLLACAQPKIIKEKDLGLYLRADFTYWEAKSDFRFKLNAEKGVQFLTPYIKYDGQPYQIVVADRAWSANKNCGFKNRTERALKYNEWVALDCNYDADKNSVTPIQKPFEFLPKGSGKYLFELKLGDAKQPTHIRVSAIKSKQTKKGI